MIIILLLLVHIALASSIFPSTSFHGNATALQVIWRNSTQAFDRDFRKAWQHRTSRRIVPALIEPLRNLTQQEAFNALYDVMSSPRLWDPQRCDSVWKSPVLESCASSEPNKTEVKLFRRQQSAQHTACTNGSGALSSYATENCAGKCIPAAANASCIPSFMACVHSLHTDAEATVHSALERALDQESSNVTQADEVMHARLQAGNDARDRKVEVSLDIVANVEAVSGILSGIAGSLTLNPGLVVAGGGLLIESQMVALARRKMMGS